MMCGTNTSAAQLPNIFQWWPHPSLALNHMRTWHVVQDTPWDPTYSPDVTLHRKKGWWKWMISWLKKLSIPHLLFGMQHTVLQKRGFTFEKIGPCLCFLWMMCLFVEQYDFVPGDGWYYWFDVGRESLVHNYFILFLILLWWATRLVSMISKFKRSAFHTHNRVLCHPFVITHLSSHYHFHLS